MDKLFLTQLFYPLWRYILKNKICPFLILFFLIIVFSSCVAMPPTPRDRKLTLSGLEYSETDHGGVERWYVVDKYNYDELIEEVRFQVGYFKDANIIGFILYEKGTTGEIAFFSREGLDLRWDWGAYGDSFRYSFVVEPDGTGLYYDFSTSSDGSAKPRGIYKVYKF